MQKSVKENWVIFIALFFKVKLPFSIKLREMGKVFERITSLKESASSLFLKGDRIATQNEDRGFVRFSTERAGEMNKNNIGWNSMGTQKR